ncbi:hypothetical protein HGRIS_005637 [Hohenbuehelia grisea]|uniref:Uncharacterized protein n=1 Tax=Hohenbuehelia grisea TaxID=104357 RepID=A0ABR3JXF4_9AGAR
MDPDRKSTVSSFYGAKSSMDALNNEFSRSAPGGQDRARRDSSSSFFNPERERGSVDLLATGRPSAAGYNKDSFFPGAREEPLKGGRDEEEAGGWDVYADFNNAGPRYSTAFGNQDQEYHQIPAVSSPTPKAEYDDPTNSGPVELVTVPGMGAEWKKSELRDMTKSGRRAKKYSSRREFFREWNRGERGLCGPYFTKKVFIFVLFGICVALALVLGFTLPRVPSFAFSNDAPLGAASGDWNDTVPLIFSRAPANFSFPAFAQLQVDTNGNYLPLHFTRIHAEVYDLDTSRIIATGDWGRHSLPAKSYPEIQIPLNFTYIATNDTDQTWKNWYGGCRNKGAYADGKRPGLNFHLLLDMNIIGLIGSRKTSTTVTGANCPVELPLNAG